MSFLRPSMISRRLFGPVIHRTGTSQLYSCTSLKSIAGHRWSSSGIFQRTRGVKGAWSTFAKGATVAGLGLGLAALNQKPGVVQCDSPRPVERKEYALPDGLPPPLQSSVSVYELGFGTVAGICAGVFVKKGAKAVAFFLGGIFVLLQYLRSANYVTVHWGKMSTRFENLFYSKDSVTGQTKAPTVVLLWKWLIDFLTADFQPRASFVCGFTLGLRVG